MRHLLLGIALSSSMITANADERFAMPGIISQLNGQWSGSDHLYNLKSKIPLDIEVVGAEGANIPLNTSSLASKLSTILNQNGISTSDSGDPLPFFHLLIMIQPFESGYAIIIAGRLFEEVVNPRVFLDSDVKWQAITWEKQDLIILPKDKLQENIEAASEEIINEFIKRYHAFSSKKQEPLQIKKPIPLAPTGASGPSAK